jgi:NADH-quinone oxidoreductase subunit J
VAVAGFLILAVASILGALSVVMQRSALYGALSLVGVFAATAVLYLMLSAPFLAVIQIIVYAGAIMVLFIFVIMLLSLRYEESGEAAGIPAGMKRMTALLLGGVLTALIAVLSFTLTHVGPAASGDVGTVEALGLVLYRKYVFPFEVASILLLVAIIGAVSITRRHGRGLEGHVGTEEEAL